MRKVMTNGKCLLDVLFLERDSYALHLFCVCVVRPPRVFKAPDIKIPMKIKPIKAKMPKVLEQAYDILRRKPREGKEHLNGT